MKWVGIRAYLCLAVAIVVASFAPAAASQDRVALVGGNSKYAHVNAIPNGVNDARAMARSLREIGFVVTEGFDLDRNGMERRIREFLRNTASARVALFFYAGHGLQV